MRIERWRRVTTVDRVEETRLRISLPPCGTRSAHPGALSLLIGLVRRWLRPDAAQPLDGPGRTAPPPAGPE